MHTTSHPVSLCHCYEIGSALYASILNEPLNPHLSASSLVEAHGTAFTSIVSCFYFSHVMLSLLSCDTFITLQQPAQRRAVPWGGGRGAQGAGRSLPSSGRSAIARVSREVKVWGAVVVVTYHLFPHGQCLVRLQ